MSDDERIRRIARFDQCDAARHASLADCGSLPRMIASIAVLHEDDVESFWTRLANETDVAFVNAVRPRFTEWAAELKQEVIERLGTESGMAFLERMASGEIKTGESDDE